MKECNSVIRSRLFFFGDLISILTDAVCLQYQFFYGILITFDCSTIRYLTFPEKSEWRLRLTFRMSELSIIFELSRYSELLEISDISERPTHILCTKMTEHENCRSVLNIVNNQADGRYQTNEH